MKVGELVKVTMTGGANLGKKGLVIDKKILRSEYRFDIFLESGQTINGVPEQYLEVISEELSDDQLEMVCGGMSTERFNIWRAEVINEK